MMTVYGTCFWFLGWFMVIFFFSVHIFWFGIGLFLYTPLAKFFDFELYGSASLSLSSEIMKAPHVKRNMIEL